MRVIADENVCLRITERSGSMQITGFGEEPRKRRTVAEPDLIHHLQATRSRLLKASKAVVEGGLEAAYEELLRCIAEIEGETVCFRDRVE